MVGAGQGCVLPHDDLNPVRQTGYRLGFGGHFPLGCGAGGGLGGLTSQSHVWHPWELFLNPYGHGMEHFTAGHVYPLHLQVWQP